MSGVIDQLPEGWRYRVLDGDKLIAGSPLFNEFADAVYGINQRFPGVNIERIQVHGKD